MCPASVQPSSCWVNTWILKRMSIKGHTPKLIGSGNTAYLVYLQMRNPTMSWSIWSTFSPVLALTSKNKRWQGKRQVLRIVSWKQVACHLCLFKWDLPFCFLVTESDPTRFEHGRKFPCPWHHICKSYEHLTNIPLSPLRGVSDKMLNVLTDSGLCWFPWTSLVLWQITMENMRSTCRPKSLICVFFLSILHFRSRNRRLGLEFTTFCHIHTSRWNVGSPPSIINESGKF